jgi:dephospho-CoA kinase
MRDSGMKSLKLGVTGGIGSGKSTVCRVFAVFGIPVFSADIEARRIMESDQKLKDQLNQLAGKDLYSTGSLDRPELAKLIFNNKALLSKVNSMVHPVVFKNYLDWAAAKTTPYSVMEAAILFESGASDLVDVTLAVIAPVSERIERIVRGNKLTSEQVMERIRNQIDDESRINLSDFIIYNSENDMIIPAVLDIHQKLLNKYNSSL